MNRLFTFILMSLFLILLAQPGFSQDTLDVSAEGIGTLNAAIAGDTLGDGSRNPNRVYRLARDAAYLITGTMEVSGGYPMRIVGADGEGARPMLIPMTNEDGLSARHFQVSGDGEWISLYLTNVDDLGLNPKQSKNMFRLVGENSRYVMHDCYIDGDTQGFFRMNSANEKLYITDCIFRNSARTGDPWDGIGIAARGGYQDTISVVNSTFFVISNRMIQAYGGVIKNMIYDHCTFAYAGGVQGGNFDLGQTINLTFTNNVLWDIGFEGDTSPESEMLPVNALNSSDFGTDADRNIKIVNNVYGWTPEITSWIESKPTGEGDSLWKYVFQDSLTDSLINVFPNMVSENNMEEALVFSDPPDIQIQVTYAESRYSTGYDNSNNSDMRVDRNGIMSLYEEGGPESYGLAEDEFDFDYNTNAVAYTQAEGGFPVGDLNWFPDKKAEWENAATGIKEALASTIPEVFALHQNYPNPFNPTTTIEYMLNTPSNVKMVIYNALGQRVKTLVNNPSQKAGSYSVQWDGRDEAGNFVSSGIYFYRLDADNLTMSKKMLMLK